MDTAVLRRLTMLLADQIPHSKAEVRRQVSPPDDPGDGSLREMGSKRDPLISLENLDRMNRVHLPQRAARLAELFLVLLVPR